MVKKMCVYGFKSEWNTSDGNSNVNNTKPWFTRSTSIRIQYSRKGGVSHCIQVGKWMQSLNSLPYSRIANHSTALDPGLDDDLIQDDSG